MYIGVVIRDVGVDGARKLGNIYWKTTRWQKNRSTTIQSSEDLGLGWVGTNVVNKEEGLILRITLEAGNEVEVNQMGGGRRHRRIF